VASILENWRQKIKIGDFFHGNGKEGTEYIRTPASVMTEMSDMLKCENPLKV
jgi:hypothetical protein